jgi:hypothetical protein
MDLHIALKEQFHAGLAMLRQCIELCPEDLWTVGAHPRQYWRVVFHAAFFTQLGIGKDVQAFRKWPGCREDSHRLWDDPAYLEPYELPEGFPLYSGEQMLDYVAFIDQLVDSTIDSLDLESNETGFPWYDNMSKLSNVLMTLRHLQGHVGQCSELLMARGIDIDWIAKAASLNDSSY